MPITKDQLLGKEFFDLPEPKRPDTEGAQLVMSTIANPTHPLRAHPLRAALDELAAFAACITPHRVPTNSPGQDDANALIDELHLLCARVDKVVEAYGEYAAQHFHGIEMPLFKNQLLDALEGNAFFVLTEAGAAAEEDRREYEAEPRQWAKAQRMEAD